MRKDRDGLNVHTAPVGGGNLAGDSESTSVASCPPADRGDGKSDVCGLIASRHARDNRRRTTHHR